MFCEQKYEDLYKLNPSETNKNKLSYVKKIKHIMFVLYALFIFFAFLINII